MRVLATFKPSGNLQTYVRTTTTKQMLTDLGIKQECYLYATETEVVAAIVAHDATPADEETFIGRYHPLYSN